MTYEIERRARLCEHPRSALPVRFNRDPVKPERVASGFARWHGTVMWSRGTPGWQERTGAAVGESRRC